MKKRGSNESKLFLTELMIAIFFFAAIAAVCIQAFSEAHVMSLNSEQLVQGVNTASNAAEYFYIWDGERESWQEFFPEGRWISEGWKMEFDENWQPVKEEGVYALYMGISEESGLKKANIVIEKQESAEVIYQLEVERGK